jgi:hypothetical protein
MPIKMNHNAIFFGAGIRTLSEFLIKPIHNGIFTFQVSKPGVFDRWMVYRGSDTKIFVFMKIFLPFDPENMFIKFLGGFGIEFSDEEKDPVPCPDEKVELQGIIESAFCFDP